MVLRVDLEELETQLNEDGRLQQLHQLVDLHQETHLVSQETRGGESQSKRIARKENESCQVNSP